MNHRVLKIIQEDFGSCYQQILHMVANDEGLYSMIDDYCACHKGITFWKNSNSEESQERIGEYRDIRKELSQEIIQLIRLKSKG